jgi:hypothetical protein
MSHFLHTGAKTIKILKNIDLQGVNSWGFWYLLSVIAMEGVTEIAYINERSILILIMANQDF